MHRIQTQFLIIYVFCRKPCSGYKLKEITGSGIFTGKTEDDAAESGSANAGSNNRTGLRMYQVDLLA